MQQVTVAAEADRISNIPADGNGGSENGTELNPHSSAPGDIDR